MAPRDSRSSDAAPDPNAETRLRRLVDSPSYRIAFEDHDFIMQHEQRAVRLQLELVKPEAILREHKIKRTIVVFGGTRIVEPEVARQRVAALEGEIESAGRSPQLERQLAVARSIAAKSHYYDAAREFARLVADSRARGETDYVVVTGGGPGVMEAANRGAWEAGAPNIGLNITLPFEQRPNSYITPELCFQFHYFAIRKMHFLLRAQALVAFPGGYGTLDELFEALTLMQTGKTTVMPVILFGRQFWDGIVDFQRLADEGTIADRDLKLFRYAETPAEAWDIVRRFHAERRRRRREGAKPKGDEATRRRPRP